MLIGWLRNKLTKNQFILLSSVMVGMLVGLAAILLKSFVHFIYVSATESNFTSFNYFYVCLPMIGILLSVIITQKILKGRLERGIAHILHSIAKKSSFIPKVQMYAQLLTSSVTVGLGGSAGLEAPMVITGAAFGVNFSRAFNLNYQDRTLLLACGISAGIAAAFNAPIAGVLFALEVLLIDISISAFAPLIIAAATGALVSKIVLKDDIILSFQLQQPFNYHNVPFYLLLSLFTGLIAVYHSRVFIRLDGAFSKSDLGKYSKAAIGGILLGGLVLVFPSLFGEGYQSIKTLSLLHPEELFHRGVLQPFQDNEWIVLFFVGAVVLIKPVAVAITIGSGGNGGNFAPSLFVGAYAGFFIAKFLNLLGLTNLPIANFTIVGMAGILSGLYHAPLTAIFLIAEITGGYTLMIPLMIVSSISYAISKHFEPFSMDNRRLAATGNIFTHDRDHNILTTIRTTNLVETDFQFVLPTDSLKILVDKIAKSRRNIFPVVDQEKNLLGVIFLDDVREIIFKHELYDTVNVVELMRKPPAIISSDEDMDSVMRKFDETGAWNLPVLENGHYIGFLTKSSVLSNYRTKLKSTSIG